MHDAEQRDDSDLQGGLAYKCAGRIGDERKAR